MVESTAHGLWVVFKRAPDAPGTWVAHCLNWDLVTFAGSLAAAVRSAAEMLTMVAADDALHGRSRSPAPAEDWAEWHEVVANGAPEPVSDLFVRDESTLRCVVMPFRVEVSRVRRSSRPSNVDEAPARVQPTETLWSRPCETVAG